MKCIICDEEVLMQDVKFWIPVERPYVNIQIHRKCFTSMDEINQLLNKNPEIVYNYIEERNKIGNKRGKT